MAIALPEFNGQQFLRALVEMHEKATAIRDQTGDLTYRLINDIQRADVQMRVGIAGLTVDAQAVPAKVLSYLTDRGLDATTLGQVNTKVTALNTALAAWRTLLGQTVFALSGSDLIEIRETNVQGETLREVSQKNAIPGTAAASLRSSSQLAAVITALEALGA
jgi:hypothetical protein